MYVERPKERIDNIGGGGGVEFRGGGAGVGPVLSHLWVWRGFLIDANTSFCIRVSL